MTRKDLHLRPADENDRELIYRWRSDPLVRANSFHTEEIPFERHCEWYRKLLADETKRQFIAELEGEPAGQVRFALEGGEALISYSVDERFRGRGLGTALLLAVTDIARAESGIRRLAGDVKRGNTASRRAFLRAGFREEGPDKEGNFRYTLELS